MNSLNSIFGRLTNKGVALFDIDSGEVVTKIEPCGISHLLYPIDSDHSAVCEHPEGIILTADDADRAGIEIES